MTLSSAGCRSHCEKVGSHHDSAPNPTSLATKDCDLSVADRAEGVKLVTELQGRLVAHSLALDDLPTDDAAELTALLQELGFLSAIERARLKKALRIHGCVAEAAAQTMRPSTHVSSSDEPQDPVKDRGMSTQKEVPCVQKSASANSELSVETKATDQLLPGHVPRPPMLMRANKQSLAEQPFGEAAILLQTERTAKELKFWYNSTVGFHRAPRKSSSTGSPVRAISSAISSHKSSPMVAFSSEKYKEVADAAAQDFLQHCSFDSTDTRITALFLQWSQDGKLHASAIPWRLRDEYGLMVTDSTVAEGLRRARAYAGGGVHLEELDSELELGQSEEEEDTEVSKGVFGIFWQRLMLGAVCRRSLEHDEDKLKEVELELIEYSELDFDYETLAEEELLFRTPLQIATTKLRRKGKYARWLRASSASPDRLLRLGVKFFLHPVAMSEAIDAAKHGMTKIDRYHHQYFVSLEVYALIGYTRDDVKKELVGLRIAHSSMLLVATGNPADQHRNWFLSMVEEPVDLKDDFKDPLDFFQNNPAAGQKVLDSVFADLEVQGRLREYQSDFLLYTVVDKSAKEVMPICVAYGHRLKYLQECLEQQKLSLPEKYIEEVSNVRLELQELRQWVGQLKAIIKTLVTDCQAINRRGDVMPWNFGAHAEGRGKGLLPFLGSTDAHLDQTVDRLQTLDEVARTFLEHHERYRDGFLNNVLLTLTVATAVFLPAQLLAGIYGTNFVNQDGEPAIPELTWSFGYHYFVAMSLGIIIAGGCLAFCCLRRS